MQLTDFLARHVKIDDFVDRILGCTGDTGPQIAQLHGDFGVQPNALFHIIRPAWRHLVARKVTALGEDGQGKAGYVQAASAVYQPAIDQCKALVPSEHFAAELYVCFWTLSLYDLETPTEMYLHTTKKLGCPPASSS